MAKGNSSNQVTTTIKDVSGPVDCLFNTKTYEATKTDGKDTVTSQSYSKESADSKCTDKWSKS